MEEARWSVGEAEDGRMSVQEHDMRSSSRLFGSKTFTGRLFVSKTVEDGGCIFFANRGLQDLTSESLLARHFTYIAARRRQ